MTSLLDSASLATLLGWTSTSLALPGFGFGLVGPYGYDLVGQDDMVTHQESRMQEFEHAPASRLTPSPVDSTHDWVVISDQITFLMRVVRCLTQTILSTRYIGSYSVMGQGHAPNQPGHEPWSCARVECSAEQLGGGAVHVRANKDTPSPTPYHAWSREPGGFDGQAWQSTGRRLLEGSACRPAEVGPGTICAGNHKVIGRCAYIA